jgi:hypothetical protein
LVSVHDGPEPEYWQKEIVLIINKNQTPDIAVIVRDRTKQRLSTTCFRGRPTARAGNFVLWTDVYHVFNDTLIYHHLIADALLAIQEKQYENSVCIDYGSTIGWSGTDTLDTYSSDDLEEFRPNHSSQALRVKACCTDKLAPKTSLLTVVYEIKHERNQVAVIVHSLYPGEDIGELRGNITEREKRVFFDWEHPGVIY